MANGRRFGVWLQSHRQRYGIICAVIEDYGYVGGPVAGKGAVPARVLGTWGDYYRVVCDAGEGIARKKASAFHGRPDAVIPTTGDFVSLKWNPHGESRILATLPRYSTFARTDPSSSGHKAQVIAVNFDTLFFLTSVNQNFNVRRLERFLSLGRTSGAPVVVLLTKSDLVDAAALARYLAEARAHAGDAEVLALSARTGAGLDALAPYVRPRRTLAFVGSSGVGKSSLVNALAGDELMPTLEIRSWDAKGRHTTTERELVRLPCGALVLDTPGMREIGLFEADDGIADAFADVDALVRRCRFSDCRHDTEPNCAVKAALADGTLAEDRWLAYRRLKAESAREEAHRVASTHRFRKSRLRVDERAGEKRLGRDGVAIEVRQSRRLRQGAHFVRRESGIGRDLLPASLEDVLHARAARVLLPHEPPPFDGPRKLGVGDERGMRKAVRPHEHEETRHLR